jgi:hypothetical protein
MAINPYQAYTAYQGQEFRPGTVDLGTLLYPALEQNLRPEVLQSADFDISPYTSGVSFPQAGPFGYYQFGQDQFAPQQTAGINQVLQNLYAANPDAFKEGFNPYSSFADWNARQNTRPGFNEGSGIGDFIGSIPGELARVGGELASERGVQGLALAAGGGSLLGGGAAGAGSAAAGGSGLGGNAAIMGMGTPISAAEASALGFDPLFAQLGGASAAGGAAGAAAQGGASVPSAPGVGVAAPAAGGAAAAGGLSGISSLLSSPAALGMAGGALLGGLGGSQQAGSITVEEGIPDWLQPYVKPALDKYSTQLQNYQIDPYGVMPSAMKEFQNTISGQYLDPSTNKYLEDYFKLGAERIKGSLSPSFGHMQAFGQHSGYNEALSRGLGDFATGLYGGNYSKERDRQTQLTAAAPSFIGQSSQAAFQPYSQYLQSVGSLGRKKEEPYFDNPFGNILGGAFTGGALGGMFK